MVGCPVFVLKSAVNRQPRLPPRGLLELFSSPCRILSLWCVASVPNEVSAAVTDTSHSRQIDTPAENWKPVTVYDYTQNIEKDVHLLTFYHCLHFKISSNIITVSYFFYFLHVKRRYLYGGVSKSRVLDPLAVQKVIDRGYKETCDMSRKILHTRLVSKIVVASKVSAKFSVISNSRTRCSENLSRR